MSTITNNGLVGDLRLAQMISQEIRLLLKDSVNLRNTPFMDFVGSINGLGSDTVRVRKAFLDGESDFSQFTGGTEADPVSDKPLVDGHVDVVVKRNALAYSITDMASMTGMGAGDIDPFRIAEHIAKSYDALFAKLTAALFTGFTAQVGAAAAMSVSVLVEAIQTLEAAGTNKGAPGPYVCVLHPAQFAELQDSIRNENNGIIQFIPASYEAISAKGSHYKGSFLGVEIYTSSYVLDDSSAYQGAMFAAGAIGYASGMPAALPGAAQTMEMGEVMVEMDRDATKALTRIVGHCYLGMAIIDDDRGVEIATNV
jgi:hypothetical protein